MKNSIEQAAETFNFMVNTWAVVFVIIVIAVFGYWVGEGVSKAYYDHQKEIDWNKRGYIRCVDGMLEIGNIDFEGNFNKAPLQLSTDICRVETGSKVR